MLTSDICDAAVALECDPPISFAQKCDFPIWLTGLLAHKSLDYEKSRNEKSRNEKSRNEKSRNEKSRNEKSRNEKSRNTLHVFS